MIGDKPLLRSGVSREIWSLLDTDQDQFKRAVEDYFAIAYPGWKVDKVTKSTRTVWLRDERKGR